MVVVVVMLLLLLLLMMIIYVCHLTETMVRQPLRTR